MYLMHNIHLPPTALSAFQLVPADMLASRIRAEPSAVRGRNHRGA